MKHLLHVILISLAVPGLVCAQQFLPTNDTPLITVTGEALVKVTPNKVTVLLGIETWNKEIQQAKKQNNDILQKAKDAIEKTGIKKKDIQTDHLSIEPRYKHEYKKKDFIGYFVRNSMSVILTEPKKIEQLITGVLTAGVTHIHGIHFETTEFKKYRQEARKLALQAAKEKAENMSAILGKRIGSPIQINEIKQYSPRHYYGGWWGYGRGQAMSQNVVQDMAGQLGGTSDTIALGKISIKGIVAVTFELK
jgi:uncharacterized protein YggE